MQADSPVARGRALEERVAQHFADHGYRTTRNVVRQGRTGAPHEVDVLAVKEDALTTYQVAVECKAWSTPIEKEVVTKLAYVKQDLGLDKGIIVSVAGCRSGAKQAAAELGIELWGREETRYHLGPAVLAGTSPRQARLSGLALPAKVSPEQADRAFKKSLTGHLGGRERIGWSSLVWIPCFEVQLAVTQSEGRFRHRTVVTRLWNAFEALNGALVESWSGPPPFEELDLYPGSIPPIEREERVASSITKAVERLQSVSTEAAIARHSETVRNLGVPVPLGSIDVERSRLVYLPFYLALLQSRDHERFVTVYAVGGQTAVPAVSAALNQRIAYVRSSLDAEAVPEGDASGFPPDGLEQLIPSEPEVGVSATSPGPQACACGGRLILRHRRSDNQPFLGCDQYPRCRNTKPFAAPGSP